MSFSNLSPENFSCETLKHQTEGLNSYIFIKNNEGQSNYNSNNQKEMHNYNNVKQMQHVLQVEFESGIDMLYS